MPIEATVNSKCHHDPTEHSGWRETPQITLTKKTHCTSLTQHIQQKFSVYETLSSTTEALVNRPQFSIQKLSWLVLIGTGIVIAGFTLAMMLVMAIDSALYIMGGILVALSIPLMLMTMVVKSLVLRRASFTSRPWQAYNRKSAELELTSSDLTFTAKCFRHAYIFLYLAGVSAICLGWVMLGTTYMPRQS